MTELLETLDHFNFTLAQFAPKIASRLQLGLTPAEIEAQVASFTWTLPQDAFLLYQWHDGLSGQPRKLNLGEKLLRLKGKWHGELTGRENEVHTILESRLIITKFLPLEYSLAGHRHLKLGGCQIDLLPFSILTDGKETIYCMMRLDQDNPVIYCANGTKLPPLRVTESFLSTQTQFHRLSELIEFLSAVFQPGIQSITSSQGKWMSEIDCELESTQLKKLYQQYKS
jgi:hypothetical protein